MQPDSGKSGGFLNKVMHLVRGSAATTGAAGTADPDSLSAREVLQEAMVRKRRNEAIRQKEFAQLRLLRQRHETDVHTVAAQTHPEDALSSLLGQETRSTSTLQKIDAIEAQMSGQWWRSPAHLAAKVGKPLTHHKLNSRQLSDLPILGEDSVVQPSVAAVQPAKQPVPKSSVPPPVASASVVAAMRTFKPHPDLEEAAILFAHGDVEGARTRLLEQLLQSLGAQPVDEEKVAVIWHAVLDLCRAIGDEDAFEPLAIDYAEHFGRSAPLWASIPDRIGEPALHGTSRQAVQKRQFQWRSPAMLTVGAVTALRTAQAQAPQPWSMSWTRLASIDEAALPALTRLLDEWANGRGQFVFSDACRLLQVLEQHTLAQDHSNPAPWWLLRLAVLRLMHRMDAYEQVALDYCVTYEVSPPPWMESASYCLVQEEGEADISVLQEASAHSMLQQQGAAAQPALLPDRSKGLAGVIEGDPQDWLNALAAQAKRGQVLDIACGNLIRLDFVAAGSILNWAADMQNQGYALRFTQLHQLVATFFHVIGIHEHATLQATFA